MMDSNGFGERAEMVAKLREQAERKLDQCLSGASEPDYRTEAGEVFGHRNIADVVVSSDFNCHSH